MNVSHDNYLKNNYLFNFCEYVFIIITLLNYKSVYVSLYNSFFSTVIKLLWHLILILLLFFLFCYIVYFKKKISLRLFSFIIPYSISIALLFVINAINYHLTISLVLEYLINPICLFILIYMLFKMRSLKSFFHKFENIVLLLAMISMVFWVLSIIGFPTNTNSVATWGSTYEPGVNELKNIPGYYYIHFIPQGSGYFFGLKFIRNSGIFMEAPIFSNILSITLFIDLFILNESKYILNYKIIILICTICSTSSTSGLLVSIPAIIYAKYIKSGKNNHYLYLLTIPIIVFIIWFLISNKMDPTSKFSSFSLRSDDIISTIEDWKHHIIIGNGIGNYSSVLNHMATWRFLSAGGGTFVAVGFTEMLAYGGILLGLFYILPVIVSIFVSHRTFGFSFFLFALFIFNGLESYMFAIMLMYIWFCFVFKKKWIQIND